jgi:hypothetical protein
VRLACPTARLVIYDEADQPWAREQLAVVDAVTNAMAVPYSAIITVGAGDVGVQAWVQASDWQAAVEDVARTLRAAAGDVVEARVLPWAEFEAELERPTLPDLVSGPEAAEILGVSRQRVHQLAHQHPDFPAPAYRLGAGRCGSGPVSSGPVGTGSAGPAAQEDLGRRVVQCHTRCSPAGQHGQRGELEAFHDEGRRSHRLG